MYTEFVFSRYAIIINNNQMHVLIKKYKNIIILTYIQSLTCSKITKYILVVRDLHAPTANRIHVPTRIKTIFIGRPPWAMIVYTQCRPLRKPYRTFENRCADSLKPICLTPTISVTPLRQQNTSHYK